MAGFRKALLFTSTERYISLMVNFLLIAVISRLLSPAQIGVAAFGSLVWALVESVRDIPSSYLIQQRNLGRDDIRTAFTVMMLITLAAVATLEAGAHQIAALYNDPGLVAYVRMMGIALLAGPFERTLISLFRREMGFDKIAGLGVAGTTVNAVTVIGLAFAGYGYMSFAWAGVAQNFTVLALAVALRPQFWVFRPRLKHWRRALRFGGVTGTCSLLAQGAEMVPYFFLNHFFRFDAVGYYNRSIQVSQAPSKLLLSGLAPVILPALAKQARDGNSIRHAFLVAISHITAVYWPAFVLLVLLAHPAVAILVGSQWLSIVPLVQIVALAMLFAFANILIYPTLMAADALRHLLIWHLIAMPASALISSSAAVFGTMPLALSLLITMPLQNTIGLLFVQRHVGFSWGEFWQACWRSILVMAGANTPPALYIALHGYNFQMSIAEGVALGLAAIFGWLVAIWLTRHPFRGEIMLVVAALRRRWVARYSNA